MLSIVMDTSNQYLAVGLYKDGLCLESLCEKGSRTQSEYAIPALDRMLKKHQIQLLEIDEMIITEGPGSYTGVRVAMTIAKTLAVISPVTIKTVSSLAAYAGNNKAISVLDARSRKVYVGLYDQGEALMPDQMMTLDAYADFKAAHPDFPVFGDRGVDEEACDEVPLCDHIYALGQKKAAVTYTDALVPVYIKEVEAKQICK